MRILLNVKKTYAGCRSFRDRGEVRVMGSVEGGGFASTVPFSTSFVRGGAFRFELTDRGLGERESRLVLWSSGEQVRAWWEAGGGERAVESLSAGLATAAGISAGASTRVPGLLMPGDVPDGLFVAEAERLADEEERSVACHRLRGRGWATAVRADHRQRRGHRRMTATPRPRATLPSGNNTCVHFPPPIHSQFPTIGAAPRP